MTQQNESAAGGKVPGVRESCERIGAELANLLRAFAPSEEVLTHFRAARVEVLKGLRAAIDARIERASQGRQKGKSVTVE
jgi:hypothetical protein